LPAFVDQTSENSEETIETLSPSANKSMTPRKKKEQIQANFLLNFHYAPRERSFDASAPSRRKKVTTPFQKERFIQANVRQFVLSGEGGNVDYLPLQQSADAIVQWSRVVQVQVQVTPITSGLVHSGVEAAGVVRSWSSRVASTSSEGALVGEYRCPICLSGMPLRCPRITKCGHVFCYPCLVHYLSLSEYSWRKCPICMEAVVDRHLRSVVMKVPSVKMVENGKEDVKFILVRRKKGTMTCLSVTNHDKKEEDEEEKEDDDDDNNIPWLEEMKFYDLPFLRFVRTKRGMDGVWAAEEKELERIIDEYKRKKEKGEKNEECDEDEIVFVEMALVRIKAARLKEYAKLEQVRQSEREERIKKKINGGRSERRN